VISSLSKYCYLAWEVRIIYVSLYVLLNVMNSKLTLKLSSNVITRAKKYAKKHNTSLSKMIEAYLDSVTGEKSSEIEITPLVKSLSGVIELPEDYDYRKDYTDYLDQKYS
jgi:hypothetical protein